MIENIFQEKPIKEEYFILLYLYPFCEDIKEIIYLLKNPGFSPFCKHGNKRIFEKGKWKTGCKKNCPCIIEHNKGVFLQKFGVDNPAKNENIKKKTRETNKEKYGVENPLKLRKEPWNKGKKLDKKIIEKRRKTNLQKWGHEVTSKNTEVRNKISKRMKNRVETEKGKEIVEKFISYIKQNQPSRKHLPDEVKNKLDDPTWLENEHKTKTSVQIAKELGVSRSLINKRLHHFGLNIHYHKKSYLQRMLENFITGEGFEIVSSSRKIIPPYEVDILVPEKNIAFEVCGLYWHNLARIDCKNYHHMKYSMLKKKGINLCTIFSDLFVQKGEDHVREMVKNYLHGTFPDFYFDNILQKNGDIPVVVEYSLEFGNPDFLFDRGYSPVEKISPKPWLIEGNRRKRILKEDEIKSFTRDKILYDVGWIIFKKL